MDAGTSDGVCMRRNIRESEQVTDDDGDRSDYQNGIVDDNEDDADSKEVRLTLMEEILLLGLKEREGQLSFWNDSVSTGLRGCILVELALRHRLDLDPPTPRRKSFSSRAVVVKSSTPTGDTLLDETLKLIGSNSPENVKSWIDYLSGDTWNPFKLPLQLRNVRERLSKSLVEKGVCRTQKLNFFVFDMMTHPLTDLDVKRRVVLRIHDGLINRWNSSDIGRIDKRLLCLILLAHHSDVLEPVLATMSDSDYELAHRRIGEALRLDFNALANASGSSPSCSSIIWAVLDAFSEAS